MDFPESAIYHESLWELQFITLKILGRQNQRWPRNLHFRLFLCIDLLIMLIIFWRFCIKVTGCVGIIVYWSQAFFITSHKANIAFVKLFETSFSSDVLDSLLNFSCQSTATFASAQTQTF